MKMTSQMIQIIRTQIKMVFLIRKKLKTVQIQMTPILMVTATRILIWIGPHTPKDLQMHSQED